VGSNSKIQGYNVYPMLHFHRKFFSGITVNSHKFSFNSSNIHSLDFELVGDRIVFPDMGNSCSYIRFLDTAISDNSRVIRGDL